VRSFCVIWQTGIGFGSIILLLVFSQGVDSNWSIFKALSTKAGFCKQSLVKLIPGYPYYLWGSICHKFPIPKPLFLADSNDLYFLNNPYFKT